MENSVKESKKKKYAIISSPTVEAAVNQLFRFGNEKQALDRINEIKEGFIISKDQEEGGKSLKLWIKGYDISSEEKEKGHIGSYAIIKIKEADRGKLTLAAEKIPTELRFHPQKRRPKQKHPDWGHPLLRMVKKKLKYETLDEANNILAQLHEEYPEVSIPSMNKLFIMIYAKTDNDEIPVKKYILLIRAEKEGGFYIDFQENKKKPKVQLPKKEGAPGEDGATPGKAQQQGYFTSMVELRKKKKGPPKKPPTDAAN